LNNSIGNDIRKSQNGLVFSFAVLGSESVRDYLPKVSHIKLYALVFCLLNSHYGQKILLIFELIRSNAATWLSSIFLHFAGYTFLLYPDCSYDTVEIHYFELSGETRSNSKLQKFERADSK